MAELGEGLSGYLDVQDATLRAPRIEAVSNIGVANTAPQHAFSVGSNLYIDTESSNVITVRGNVVTEGVKVGTIEIIPSYDLAAVSNVGNVTANTIIFTNETQGFVATGNATIGSTLTVSGFRITAAAAAEDDLEAITTAGATTSKAIHITNGTDSTTPYTGALQIGTNTGANGGLGVAGNVHVNQGVYTQDLSVSGEIVSNLAVNTDDLFVDIVNSRVGIGKTEPTVALDVVGAVNASGNVAVDTNTLFVDSVNNKVGVGTTEPGATLEVTGNAYVSSNLEVGTANLFVDTVNSRVGIGTTSPNVLLELSSATGSATITPTELRLSSSTDAGDWDTTTPYARLAFYTGDATADAPGVMASIGAVASSADGGENTRLSFFTAEPHVERMCVDRYGNVGIGTTNPGNSLHIYKNANERTSGLFIEKAQGGTNAAALFFGVNDTGENPGVAKAAIFYERNMANGRGDIKFCNNAVNDATAVTPAVADTRMIIKNNGNVGIGLTDPSAKFHVTGGVRIYGYESQSDNGGSDAYFVAAGVFSNPPFAQYSLYLQYWCRAIGYTALSDSRIKNNIVDVTDSSALETLRALQPKYYNYIDTRGRGSNRVIGFIAQEVKEVCPDAVTTCRDYIPNIYELATVSDSNVITFTNFNTSNLESNASVINTIGIGGEHRVNIVEVVDEHTIRVEEDLSEWTGSVDETGNVVAGNQLFVYGQEVDDFHNLNKDALFSVATASIQEIDRQLQAEKARNDALEARIAALESA